jgi:hypothetical protein
MQPAGRSGNQAASVAFAFVETALGSENDWIAERQIVGHVDPVLALLLEGDQPIELRRLGLLGLDLIRDALEWVRSHLSLFDCGKRAIPRFNALSERRSHFVRVIG